MKQNARQFQTRAVLPSGAVIAMSLIACVGDPEEGIGLDGQGKTELFVAGLTEPVWEFCARVGAPCRFSGTRQVRYGRGSRWTVRTFTDGVQCTSQNFGLSTGIDLFSQCQVDVSEPIVEPPEGEPEPPAQPGPSEGNMPYINEAAIPTGSPGTSRVQIIPTNERPGRTDGDGAFRTACGFSHMNFDDPIAYPGRPRASHLHAFFGNTLTNANSTAESLRTTGNSTCRGGIANRSAYWVPAVIDRNGTPVAPFDLGIYYKTGYLPPRDIKPFPQGLRILAGDPMASSRQPWSHWQCDDGVSRALGSIPTNCEPNDFVVMTIPFPQCWDGRNLDSPDHRSHMAYPEDDGCPRTHPVAIPAITFKVYYRVPTQGTSGWRLASDMYDASLPGGFSAHGDWFEAWDPDLVAAWVKHCDNAAVDCRSHLTGDGREMY